MKKMPMIVRRRGVRKVGGRRVGAVRRRPTRLPRMGKQMYNPLPTFVETFQPLDSQGRPVPIAANAGGTLAVRITDIPQVAQYANLYNMYKVNWVKVILTARSNSIDQSAWLATGRGNQTPIMYYATQDTPFAPNPATVQDVLKMNGARIKPLITYWSKSFKPTAAVQETTAGGVVNKREVKQYYTFDTVTTGNNPLFQGIAYFIACAIQGSDTPLFDVTYKVCFTLRDPK